jgi:CRP-like cAMP-binding protein
VFGRSANGDTIAAMAARSVSKRTQDWVEWLRRIQYLAALPDNHLMKLAAAASLRHVDAGGFIFTEGEAPSGIFLLVSGRAKVVRTSRNGREQVLHEDGPGATLGEVPVFDGEGYVGSAVAVEDCALLFLPREALLSAIDANPGAARCVIAVLSRRVRRFAVLVADLSLRDTTERLAAHLLREVQQAGGDVVSLNGTREELASHLGTVREEVSRGLSELRDRGILAVDRRRIRVLDMPRLRAIAGESATGGGR